MALSGRVKVTAVARNKQDGGMNLGDGDVIRWRAKRRRRMDFGDFDLAHVMLFTPTWMLSIAVLTHAAAVAGSVSQMLPCAPYPSPKAWVELK